MAKRRYRFLDNGRPELIASRINQALDIAIQETGKKQWQIAEEIAVSKNTLTNWRKGRTVPNDHDFGMFLNFLGQLNPPITEEFFNGAFKDDPYVEDPDYVAAMSEDLKQYAKDIGLDLNFLRYVVNSLGFEEYYIPYGPIRMKENKIPSKPDELHAHERLIPAESNVAEAAGDFRVGKRILSKVDLYIIAELQDLLGAKLLILNFLRLDLDMHSALRKANELRREKYLKALENSEGAELSTNDMVLTVGEMESIDKYFKRCLKGFMDDVSDDTLITEIPWENMGAKKI